MVVAACSNFSSGTLPAVADAGSDGGDGIDPLTGLPNGTFRIKLSADSIGLARRSTTRVPFSIEISTNYLPTLHIELKGASSGITAAPLDLPPGATDGTMLVQVSDVVALGASIALTIEATANGAESDAKFTGQIRGKPGEADGTFGVAGQASIPRGAFASRSNPATGEAWYAGVSQASLRVDAAGAMVAGFSSPFTFQSQKTFFFGNGYVYGAYFPFVSDGAHDSLYVAVDRFDFTSGVKDSGFHLIVGKTESYRRDGQARIARWLSDG